MFPSTLEWLVMTWFELLAKSIDYFKTLANLFTNTYSVYRDVRKRHVQDGPQVKRWKPRNLIETFRSKFN